MSDAKTPQEVADEVAATYFGVTDEASRRRVIRECLIGVGAFWLIGRACGALFGWFVTSGVIPITQQSWRWLFGVRVFLAAVVPLMLALPLTRYVRGKSTLIALPLLILVTLLPISSAMNVSLDLWEGPTVRQVGSPAYLKHTKRQLEN